MSFFGDGVLGRWISLLGLAVVSVYFGYEVAAGHDNGLEVPIGIVSLLGWLALWMTRPERNRLRLGITLITVAAGAIASAPTDGLMIAPVVVCVMAAMAAVQNPPWVGPVVALVAAGLIPVGALTVQMTIGGILAMEAGVGVALLGGFSRRQTRIADRQQRELAERTMAMREEQARADVLTSRQELAREIHDVLAHSLGGLVVQLDAVEALLESDRVDDARSRVADARRLASSGLAEARRAVDALRTRPESEPDADLTGQVDELIAAHRGITDSEIALRVHGVPRAVPAAEANALRRALQEALSNARKHAPGRPVSVDVDWEPDAVRLRIANPVGSGAAEAGAEPSGAASLAATGGGHGLPGMRERFAELHGAGLSAEVREDEFVVTAEVRLPPVRADRERTNDDGA